MDYYRLQVVIRGTPGNASELFATDNEDAGETFRVRIRKSDKDGNDDGALGNMTEIGTDIGVWYYDFTMGSDLSRYYMIQTSYPDAANYTDKKLIKLRLDGSLLFDDVDPTKQLEFNLLGATTGKKITVTASHTDNRTITIPDATDTIVLLGETQTLINKRLTSPKINEDVELGATSTELDKLDGVTAGTLLASKAVVVDADKKIDYWDIDGTFKVGGVAVTSTAAELNILDGASVNVGEINTLDGATGKVAGLAQAQARTTTEQSSGDKRTLSDANAGFIECDSSANVLDIELPPLSKASAGVIFIISLKTAGNNCVITDNAADSGFSLANADDAQSTGTSITLDTAKDFVILQSSGIVGGYWAIIGGFGVNLA